jgi:hypothetical protein
MNDITLTDIAHEAAKADKKYLAKKLLERESSVAKKIPVLVWMKEYETSLEAAFQGKNTNMINLVLSKVFKFGSDDERRSLYQRVAQVSPDLVLQVTNYLKRTQNTRYLKEFMDQCKNTEFARQETLTSTAQPLHQVMVGSSMNAKEYLKGRIVELKRCRDIAENAKDKETAALIQNEINAIDYHFRDPACETTPVGKFRLMSIEEICVDVLVKSKGDTSQKGEFYRVANKEFKLSKRKIEMIKMKALAALDQTTALKDHVIAINKKKEVLPYSAIFDYLESISKQAVNCLLTLDCTRTREVDDRLRACL